MRFDDVFEYVGGAGPYQVGIMLQILALGFVSIDALRMNFAGGQMKHWCTIPALANLSHDHQKYVGIPITEDDEYSECRRFNLDFSNFTLDELIAWNRTKMTGHIPESEWVNCDNDWTYDQSDFTSTIVSKWDLVCDQSWMVQMISTFYMIGWMLGCIITGPLSDRFGRKTTLLTLHLLRTAAAYLVLYSPWYAGFAVGRVLMGLSSPNVNLVFYVIVAEITSTKWRSTFGISWNIVYCIGGMVIPGFAYYVRNHYYFEGVFIWPLIIFFVFVFTLDESPRWLVSQGRDEEAIKILRKVAKVNKGSDKKFPNDMHFEEERKKREAQQNVEKGTFVDLLRTPNIRKKTLIVWLHWFTVSLVYYGLSLNAGRLPGSIYLNAFLLSMVEGPANLIGMVLLPRIGRRWLTGGATVLGGVATMLCVAFISNEDLEVVATALSVLGKACAAAGFGGIYVFTAELAPTQIRNIGMGTSSLFARISGAVAPFVGGPMGDIYAGLPSIIFGAFGLVAGGLIFLLPETLGEKLPETIAEAEAFGKKKSKNEVLPPLEIDAEIKVPVSDTAEQVKKMDGFSNSAYVSEDPVTFSNGKIANEDITSTQL